MANIHYPISKIQKAFSLIEVMIAVFILLVGILAVLTMFPFGVRLARYSKMTTIATQLAQEKIEEIISKSYADISKESEQTLGAPFDDYSRKTDVTCFDPNGVGLSPNCPDDTGIKEIKVTVSWTSPLRASPQKIELSTLIAER